MNQVLYTILKVVMDLILHFMAAKETSKTIHTSPGTCEGKTNQLLRRPTTSLKPESRTLREAVGGGSRSCGPVNGTSCGSYQVPKTCVLRIPQPWSLERTPWGVVQKDT